MKTVFIGALPFRATEEFIHDLIQPYRPDVPIEIFADWSHPTFEPYALVRLDDPERAVDELDGRKFGATHLRVHIKGANNG